jgi:hypothetical protein
MWIFQNFYRAEPFTMIFLRTYQIVVGSGRALLGVHNAFYSDYMLFVYAVIISKSGYAGRLYSP